MIFLGLLLFISKGNTNTNDTIYLNPDESTPVYRIYVLKGEHLEWSFKTYDNSFNVDGFILSCTGCAATEYPMLISVDRTSNSGEIPEPGYAYSEEGYQGNSNVTFSFQNVDTVGGYIQVKLWIKQEIDYTIFLYFFIPIFIVSIIIIGLYYQRYQRKKQLKEMRL